VEVLCTDVGSMPVKMWLVQMWTFRAVDQVVMALLKDVDRSWCGCGWTDFVIPSSW
jgi:hypothetical protein